MLSTVAQHSHIYKTVPILNLLENSLKEHVRKSHGTHFIKQRIPFQYKEWSQIYYNFFVGWDFEDFVHTLDNKQFKIYSLSGASFMMTGNGYIT